MARELLERFKRTGKLPSPPGTVVRLLALCQDEDIPLADLIDTVAADPALSLRLLKYANSSLVGSTEPITTIRDAVLCLGIRSVRLMALNFSVMTTREEGRCPGFDYGRFWCHSVTCGVAARYLARRTSNVSPDEAFTAGLLAHTGKMVFAMCRPEEYAEILRLSGGITGPTAPLEEQHFNTSYAELSAELMEDWGIPQRLAQAVRFHKRPGELAKDAVLQRFAGIVGIAAVVADLIAWAESEGNLSRHCEALVGSEFIANVDQARAAVEEIREEATELTSIMSLKAPAVANPGKIQQQAAQLRGELSMATRLQAAVRVQIAPHPLPGPAERAGLEAELTRRNREAVSAGVPLTLILVDVDHFEQIVETHGAAGGDTALGGVAEILRRQLRSVDFMARFGCSTFAVLLSGPNHQIAAQICVRIRRAVEVMSASRPGSFPPFTVSLGATQWIPTGSEPAATAVMEAVLQQLGRSKAKGCNACSMKVYKIAGCGPARVDSRQGPRVFIGT